MYLTQKDQQISISAHQAVQQARSLQNQVYVIIFLDYSFVKLLLINFLIVFY